MSALWVVCLGLLALAAGQEDDEFCMTLSSGLPLWDCNLSYQIEGDGMRGMLFIIILFIFRSVVHTHARFQFRLIEIICYFHLLSILISPKLEAAHVYARLIEI